MPGKPRIEFEGACYHVIGRGNYRQDLFLVKGAEDAFERALLETAERQQWQVYAFVVMSTHYHIALETLGGKNLQTAWAWIDFCRPEGSGMVC